MTRRNSQHGSFDQASIADSLFQRIWNYSGTNSDRRQMHRRRSCSFPAEMSRNFTLTEKCLKMYLWDVNLIPRKLTFYPYNFANKFSHVSLSRYLHILLYISKYTAHLYNARAQIGARYMRISTETYLTRDLSRVALKTNVRLISYRLEIKLSGAN